MLLLLLVSEKLFILMVLLLFMFGLLKVVLGVLISDMLLLEIGVICVLLLSVVVVLWL